MMLSKQYFQYITEGVPIISGGKNKVYYAEAQEYYTPNAFRNFSIKIPLQGILRYKTAHRQYELRAGSVLLAGRQQGQLTIDSKTTVRSLCIDIDQQTINEAYNILAATEAIDIEVVQSNHFFSPTYYDNIYSVADTAFLQQLTSVTPQLVAGTGINEEFFLHLAEQVVLQQLSLQKGIISLKIADITTRKELYKRLLMAKEYMDLQALKKITVKEIAAYAGISLFYFYRSFKIAFGCSPYLYITNKRLECALNMISKQQKISYVAAYCGFPDLPTFSKAFKRRYLVSPSAVR